MNHAEDIQARDGVAVVLYGKPRCVQCDATERKLRKHRIHFTKVDVSQDETALNFIKQLGYTAAPVVYVSTIEGDVHWTQFDIGMIEQHITARPDAEVA
ncbi:glutaredoxin family protein [Arthrobacter sp. 1P04PC]|uniref:glutaredoxin family protein n=1 Tax=unclassified Arthrobacter TaxID=235627 RepID=UPI0039A1C2C8